MKTCSNCKIEKSYSEFYTRKESKDNKSKKCKQCVKAYDLKNTQKRKEYNKKYYKKNREKYLEHHQEYYQETKIKKQEYAKQYYKENKKQYNTKTVEYAIKRYNTDPEFKIEKLLRNRIIKALKNNQKKSKTLELLGCTIEEYKLYLQKQFKPEMNWDNHGTIWEIDHIIPCSSFDLTQKEQQLKCFNYINIQPLFKTTSIAESFGYVNETGNRNKSNNLDN